VPISFFRQWTEGDHGNYSLSASVIAKREFSAQATLSQVQESQMNKHIDEASNLLGIAGRESEVMQLAQLILDQSPNAKAYYFRGYAKDDLAGSRDTTMMRDAISDFNHSILINPKDAKVYRARGYVNSKLSQYQEALQDYGNAIYLDPKDWQAYRNRATLLETLGKKSQACSDFKQAKALGGPSGVQVPSYCDHFRWFRNAVVGAVRVTAGVAALAAGAALQECARTNCTQSLVKPSN
jgi:tetratricopeptide (TPR) repeat protein